jgi:hypothetical protein
MATYQFVLLTLLLITNLALIGLVAAGLGILVKIINWDDHTMNVQGDVGITGSVTATVPRIVTVTTFWKRGKGETRVIWARMTSGCTNMVGNFFFVDRTGIYERATTTKKNGDKEREVGIIEKLSLLDARNSPPPQK